ncbi:MAG: VWA domain-containing protein [Treponema sp.]
MKKTFIRSLLILGMCLPLFAVDLELEQRDLAVIQDPKGEGYHFYIRKKPDIASILITETTKDPERRLDNFAYRTADYNSINGDEKRLLNGKELDSRGKKLYSLIDSTPEYDTPIGEAFHIWVPYIIYYGYEWTRSGEVQVLDGTFFNIRAFEKPYADYAGTFCDNPFVLRVTQKSVKEADEESFSELAVSAFSDFARQTGNKLIYAKSVDSIIPAIEVILMPHKRKNLDVVFVIDATESMKDDIQKIRESLQAPLEKLLGKYTAYRIALVLYKDYNDDFLVKTACDFTSDLKRFSAALNSFRVFGGRDIPEAVYEGMQTGLDLDWNSGEDTDRRLILIGDAPPHPRAQGSVTKETVAKAAREKNVRLFPIILPHKKTY